MNECAPEPLTVWRFIRRYFVQIVIGGLLVAAVYGFICIDVTYQREQQIARKIEALTGIVHFEYCGPKWIPHSFRDRMPFLQRITLVAPMSRWVPGTSMVVHPELVAELGSLSNLRYLFLDHAHISDVDLENLKGLKSLEQLELHDIPITDLGLHQLQGMRRMKILNLSSTQVTDAGLEYLKGLTNLSELYLEDTRTTEEGRAMLQKALPNCNIHETDDGIP